MVGIDRRAPGRPRRREEEGAGPRTPRRGRSPPCGRPIETTVTSTRPRRGLTGARARRPKIFPHRRRHMRRPAPPARPRAHRWTATPSARGGGSARDTEAPGPGATTAQAPASGPDDGTASFSLDPQFEDPASTLPPGLTERVDRPPQVPGYENLEVLGIGGMGIVYKARQIRLDRFVALKMILRGGSASLKTSRGSKPRPARWPRSSTPT